MPICFKCSKKEGHDVFYPPDMIDELEKSGEYEGKRICHFCKYNTDVLIGKDGTKYEKQAVLKDYRDFCEEIYQKPSTFTTLSKLTVDHAVKNMK